MSDRDPGHATDQFKSPFSVADDLLRGADAIATFLFGDPKHRRKIYHLAADTRRRMPHFKLGSIICARRSVLLRWIAEQENRQRARSRSRLARQWTVVANSLSATARPLGSKRAKVAWPLPSADGRRTPARRIARREEPMNPSDILGDDIIVTASTSSARSASGPCRISGWAAGSVRAAAPSSPGSMPRTALAMADSRTRVSRKRLNELAATKGLYTPDLTPPEQGIAWFKAIPEAQVNLPLIVCIGEATRP